MNVSLDTDITIHLYSAGKEVLLYKYFERLYIHEFVLEREIKNKSKEVYERIKIEIATGRIELVNQRYLIDLGMKNQFENRLEEIKILFDYGEANAVALASTLGIAALVTDDTKEYGPHDTLLKELIDDVIPFAFYELLYLEYLQSDNFDELRGDFEYINHIAYSEYPIKFVERIKRTVRRFSKNGTERDIQWIKAFCVEKGIDYRFKMKKLKGELLNLERDRNNN